MYCSCEILKRRNNFLWWDIDGKFYNSSNNEIKTIDNKVNVIDADTLEFRNYRSDPVEDSNYQDYHSLNKLDATVRTGSKNTFNITCFVIRYDDDEDPKEFTSDSDVLKYYNTRNTAQSKISSKTIEVTIYNLVINPVIKGPLSVIQVC